MIITSNEFYTIYLRTLTAKEQEDGSIEVKATAAMKNTSGGIVNMLGEAWKVGDEDLPVIQYFNGYFGDDSVIGIDNLEFVCNDRFDMRGTVSFVVEDGWDAYSGRYIYQNHAYDVELRVDAEAPIVSVTQK